MAVRDEFSLIDQIRRRAVVTERTPLGIGDDAALLTVSGDAGVLLAVDVLTEGVHFDLNACAPEAVGRKALAVNLSDIAAMAGRPTAALVGLVLPRQRSESFIDRVMEGLFQLAAEFDVEVVGGDTNTWDGPFVISVTVVGEPTGGRAISRGGACAGDWLMVTGALGGSLSGRHLSFRPRVSEAQLLHQAVDLHAMIDLSDGIASDARHIARESNVGLIVEADAIPIHEDVDPSQPLAERQRHAISDGEDFELLFTVSAEDGQRLVEKSPLGISITRIGEVVDGTECRLRYTDGRIEPLPKGGWVHRFDHS